MLKQSKRHKMYPQPIEMQMTFSCKRHILSGWLDQITLPYVGARSIKCHWLVRENFLIAFFLFVPYSPWSYKENEPFMSIVAQKTPEKKVFTVLSPCHLDADATALPTTSGRISIDIAELAFRQQLHLWWADINDAENCLSWHRRQKPSPTLRVCNRP